MNLENLIENVLEKLKTVAKSETVIGEQFKLGDYICVPIVKISLGFGGAGGEGDANPKAGGTGVGKATGTGGGTGGGVTIEPIGFLVNRGEDIAILNVERKNKGLAGVVDKMPDLLDKMMDLKKKKDENKNTNDNESKG